MNRLKFIDRRFWKYCCISAAACFLLLLFSWFTGLGGDTLDSPRTVDELLYAVVHYPHVIFGLPIVFGLLIGYFLRRQDEPERIDICGEFMRVTKGHGPKYRPAIPHPTLLWATISL